MTHWSALILFRTNARLVESTQSEAFSKSTTDVDFLVHDTEKLLNTGPAFTVGVCLASPFFLFDLLQLWPIPPKTNYGWLLQRYFLTGQMPFQSPNQQCQSSEGYTSGTGYQCNKKHFVSNIIYKIHININNRSNKTNMTVYLSNDITASIKQYYKSRAMYIIIYSYNFLLYQHICCMSTCTNVKICI